MAIFRIPLSLNRDIKFYKLMGCGRNGTFDIIPDLQQWGILTTRDHYPESKRSLQNEISDTRYLYGRFISRWFSLMKCEIWTIQLEPVQGHGLWDGKQVFGALSTDSTWDGMVAILTRASIRLSTLRSFWRVVPPVNELMNHSPGFILSAGLGEAPWIRPATFSIWENIESMKAFAFGSNAHADVISQARKGKWFREEMFVRFRILGTAGTLRGKNPLSGKM